MSDLKRECPGCGSYSSTIGAAFMRDEPCPQCGLLAAAADAVTTAKERHVSEELQRRYVDAERRAAEAERRASSAEAFVNQLRDILDEWDQYAKTGHPS